MTKCKLKFRGDPEHRRVTFSYFAVDIRFISPIYKSLGLMLGFLLLGDGAVYWLDLLLT